MQQDAKSCLNIKSKGNQNLRLYIEVQNIKYTTERNVIFLN